MKIGKLRAEDMSRYLEFNKVVFGEENIERELDELIYNNPFCIMERDCYYLEKDEEMVSALVATRKFQKVGKEIIRVVELDLVGTHPHHRKKGYCRYLIEKVLINLKKEGISLCRLIGIPKFYQNFGFEYAVPAYFYNYLKISKNRIKCCKKKYSVLQMEEFKDETLRKMIQVFHKENHDNFGSEERSIEYLRYMIQIKASNSQAKWFQVVDQEQFLGYAWIHENIDKIEIKEVVFIDNDAAESLCSRIYELMVSKDYENVGVRCPLNNRFGEYIYRLGASRECSNEIYEGTWGEMYNILDLKQAFKYMSNTLSERLINSQISNLTAIYTIETEDEYVSFIIDRGNFYVSEEIGLRIKISKAILTQLYTGYRGIEYYSDVIVYENRQMKEVFEILFPKGFPYIWTLDINDSLNEKC